MVPRPCHGPSVDVKEHTPTANNAKAAAGANNKGLSRVRLRVPGPIDTECDRQVQCKRLVSVQAD